MGVIGKIFKGFFSLNLMSRREDCIFCKMARGEIPSEKICENDNFFSILDRNQDIKGHALVISKRHFFNTLDLPSLVGADFLECIKETSLKLMKNYNAGGFNMLGNNFKSAGQIVEHFHVHILPRKDEDGVSVVG